MPGQTNLEHLDEWYAQVQICQVATDEAATVQKTDWDHDAHIHATRHPNMLSAIKQPCGSCQDLRGDGGEEHVPACQKYSCITVKIRHQWKARLGGAGGY